MSLAGIVPANPRTKSSEITHIAQEHSADGIIEQDAILYALKIYLRICLQHKLLRASKDAEQFSEGYKGKRQLAGGWQKCRKL